MRIGAVLLLLLAVGYLAATVPATPPAPAAVAGITWRRTSDGWRRGPLPVARPAPTPPAVHPAIFAGVQLLFAVSGLVGLSQDEE